MPAVLLPVLLILAQSCDDSDCRKLRKEFKRSIRKLEQWYGEQRAKLEREFRAALDRLARTDRTRDRKDRDAAPQHLINARVVATAPNGVIMVSCPTTGGAAVGTKCTLYREDSVLATAVVRQVGKTSLILALQSWRSEPKPGESVRIGW